MDLNGNTYWEFKDAINTGRMRRIVKADPKMHHADLSLSPQWLQWLRHTRTEAPTIEEQKADLVRQIQLKHLAKLADAKWKAKQSHVEAPILTEAQRRQLESIKGAQHKAPEPRSTPQAAKSEDAEKKKEMEQPEVVLRGQKIENPFARNRPSAPSETWQPEAWSPAPRRK
ncbi:hypothetical protein KEM56_004504 [Ascosphaera pollenicola]|nr:hypothetical protein KEM56_004504 [Ascosphaera pollenicola]